MIAIVTGGSGRVGPIWMDELTNLDYDTYDYDLPDDVTDLGNIQSFLGDLPGPVDVLVNNAAIDNPPGSGATFFGNMTSIIKVNLLGAAQFAGEVIPGMIENGGGTIINIGSIMGFGGADWRNYEGSFEKPVAYGMSKAGLVQLSRSITTQYGRYGVRSVTIAFGPLETPDLPEKFRERFLHNVPLGRMINEDSWRAAMRFAIECPEFAGQSVLVDGGLMAW